MTDTNTTFKHIAFTHFVPCFFLGVISLLFLLSLLPNPFYAQVADGHFDTIDAVLGVINGLFVASLAACFHVYRNRRIQSGKLLFFNPMPKKGMAKAAVVGFAGGAFEVLFGMLNAGIILLTLLVLIILVWHLRVFAKDVQRMLKPGNHATWGEVAELMRIYLTMMAGFTLLNATLEVAHILMGTPPPFGFGAEEGQFFLNSLYFTVVTMTTLGFGDIVPQTWDGKLLLIFQTLAGYIMFALMVGIITRGVAREQDEIENE